MQPVLLRALRIVVQADSDPARQVLFANLMQARRSVRMAFRLHAAIAGTWASAVLISGYGLAYFLRIAAPTMPGARVLSAAKHVNAKRQVDRIGGWLGPGICERLRNRLTADACATFVSGLPSQLARGRMRRTLRVVRRLDRRHGFLVACRAAAAIAWYDRSKGILARHRPGAVLVSSDANPEEVGFAAAARTLGVPRVFVAHAYPTPFSPPLDFELSILEGEAAVRARERKGPIAGTVVFCGVEGESSPIDPERIRRTSPVIGIFAPKALSWTTLSAIVAECRQHFRARRIVIRWHPSRLDPARHLPSLGETRDIVETPASASLADVARQCDWVVADENSNVHLPVLKLGIPTVAVKRLGLYPESRSDMYGFAAAGVVFPPVGSLAEVQPDAFAAFFRSGWIDRFRRYDAAYLRPSDEIAADVRAAVYSLFEPAVTEARYAS